MTVPGETAAHVRAPLPDAITAPRLVAIARRVDPDRLSRLAAGLLAGGVRALEVTLDSPSAAETIDGLVRRFAGSSLVVGAGTVLEPPAAREAVAAGAGFLVSPHTDPAILGVGVELGVPAIAGAMTPTEILAAWRAGASAVKVFPASAVGASFIREVRGPLPGIPLIPTGGVTIDTAPALLAAGAVAVGIGSWLTGDGDPDGVARRAADLVRALADA